MSRLVYVLNGPNLNLLGKRQPDTVSYTHLDVYKRQVISWVMMRFFSAISTRYFSYPVK